VGGNSQSIVNFNEWRLFAEKPVTRMENVHISGELSSETLQTGYIKWPKVPLKANESEGYVATRSSRAYPNYEAWKAFNENANSSDDAWLGGLTNYITGGYPITTSGAPEMNGVYGDWLGIELPQSIKVSYIQLLNRNYSESARLPISGRFYGSKDNITFTELTAWSNISISPGYEPTRIDVNSNDTYKTYRIQVERISVASGGGSCAIGELQLFEAATGVGAAPTSAKLQVAGSLGMAKGSEFFAGDDVVMELPKHDRPLVKYPEVAMTAATTSGYTASASRYVSGYYPPYRAFNELKGGSINDVGWHTGTELAGGISDYRGTNNAFVGTERLSSETVLGEWITIELPNPIKLVETHLWTQYNYAHVPKGGVFYGKRNASDTWTQLYSYTGQSIADRYNPQVHTINETRYFKYFAYVATERYLSGSGISVGEWELYGTEEGDTSVDVVHRSIPNKPGQQHLEVYWDANDSGSYSFADSTKVYDLSGNGVTGTITGTNGFDSEYNAWVFDGSGDYISGTQGLGTGQPVHSQSVWFKRNGVTGTYQYINIIGTSSGGTQAGFVLYNNGVTLQTSSYGNDIKTIDTVEGQWYHAVLVHTGGDWTSSNTLTYVNGELATVTSVSKSYTFNLTGTTVTLGTNTSGTQGFNGSIANFRLFGKALNADQVRELYEYDAPRFGHRQNVVSLHKGNLGVGVAHPTSRFEVAGADGIQEYPPKAMTGYETYMEGHGVFRASSSSLRNGHKTWQAFDKTINNKWPSDAGGGDTFGGTDNAYNGTNRLSSSTALGAWLKLELPHKILLKTFSVYSSPTSEQPEDFILYGSVDGNTWEHVFSKTGAPQNSDYVSYVVNSTSYYDHFAIIMTRTISSSTIGVINEWKLFGTPGPTTLDKGSLTLGRSLDVPRISRYDVDTETPRPEKLLVDFDTTVNSLPTDISGKGNHGAFKNDSEYSAADKAFKFAAANAHIYLEQNTLSGTSATHTFSLWINALSGPGNGNYEAIFEAGVRTSNQAFGLYAYQDGSNTRVYYHVFGNNLPSNTTGYIVNTNSWYHICGTLDNSGNVRRFYVNGELFASDTYGSLNVTHPRIRIGENVDGSESWHGMVSNFKLYSVALEPSEVQKLYRLGRTGRSMVISDTAVGIGKVPEAQLDVRGNINSDGIMTNKNYMFWATGPTTVNLQNDHPTTSIKADFSRLEFDLGGGFDTSTKTYTIPCSGYWEFDYCLLARNRDTGSQYVMGTWYINGATYDHRTFVYFTGQGGGSQESNLIGKIVGYWPAGTTVAVRISQNTGNTDVYMYYVYSSFYGKLLH
jgi:hypothetical protein